MRIPSLPPLLPPPRRLLLVGGLALACLLFAALAYQLALAAFLDGEREAASRRLAFYALSLEGALARHEALPGLLALEPRLHQLLDHPQDAAAVAACNAYLQRAQAGAGISVAYLIDLQGHTLAASNWNQPGSFVGHNYGFRPYFREAAAGGLGRFYAVGVTTGEPGYFLAAPVREGGREGGAVRGVITIKVNLAASEAELSGGGDSILLADAAGVVFLAAEPAWRYRTLAPLPPATRAALAATRQYGDSPLQPLAPSHPLHDGTVRLDDGSRFTRELIMQSRPVGSLGWRAVLLADPADAHRSALGVGFAAAFALAFVLAVLAHQRLHRTRREELRRAQAELEQAIAERTADLTDKVAALRRTQAILSQTRDTAVQAGKLAVLGQMSAGMSHELNQPLAALQTFSDNAAALLELGRLDELRDNLVMIRQLTARLGRIVAQLKSFARKGPAEKRAVDVASAIDNALLILEPRRRELRATVELAPVPAGLAVQADATRLEQVLVNLLRNGLDAMQGQPSPRLHLAAGQRGDEVRITLRDEGTGLPEEVRSHLFEPFYTTKPAGEGLGLGLAISLTIIEGFGGRLEGGNAPQGGAEFTIILDAATATATPAGDHPCPT
ncbi:sensor histidine kinase [Azoarcus indigens]|uniref:C4-dicarboxylate transport sensor protein DctB n=1 Tax=Azoarcus indigens TaxID=29545 RepID=A0A4R6E6J1_9RHOO|nr:ATP-binding protein [Azoarcus indigens]NMG66751.1 sensor histidine kinase [Azoarcus indigens]TDN53523.1 two-component system C4-dicarboxylate transport sensor histidine kinase DctB [Azoarcus indigens]